MASNVTVSYNFVAGTPAIADNVDQNFTDLTTWINTNAVHLDASKAFTSVPSGPAVDPSSDNQLARKAYVDRKISAVTSSTRPSSPVAGQLIWETDTQRVRVWNATTSLWQLVSGAQGVSATGTGIIGTTSPSTITITYATENYDTDNFFTAGGSVFTIPEAGTYAITTRLTQTAGNTFVAGFGSYGNVIAPGSNNYYLPASTHLNNYIGETYVLALAAADTITTQFTNGSSGSITFTANIVIRRIGD